MPATPRSDASKTKLEQLRASGYTGPVDQDGKPVTSDVLDALRRQ